MVMGGEIEAVMMSNLGVIKELMMADVDLGLNIQVNSPLTILENLLVAMGEVDIGPIPATLPPITQVTMVYCCAYLVLLAMWVILLMKTKEVIVEVMVQDVEVGLKRSYTIP